MSVGFVIVMGSMLAGLPPAAQAPGPKAQGAASAGNEATYQPRQRRAADLAELLREVLPVDVKIVADKLVLRGADDALILANTFLGRLDRAPRKFELEFLVAEIAPAFAATVSVQDFAGSFQDIKAKVDELQKSGQVKDVRQHGLSALEGSQAAVKDERTEPFPSAAPRGVKAAKKGKLVTPATRVVGAQISVIARAHDECRIGLELSIQNARLFPDPDAAALGADANGQPLRASAVALDRIDTQLALAPNQAGAILGGARSGRSRLLVVVTVRVVP